MKSIFLLVKASLARRKAQNIMIGMSLIMVSLLFSLSTGILATIQQPFDKVFDELHAPHILLLYDFRSDNGDSMKAWFARQPETESTAEPDAYYNCNGPLFTKSGKIDLIIQLTELGENHKQQDQLKVVQGLPNATSPGLHEIWLPNYLALQHHIQVGDSISIPASGGVYSFKVSAAVADALYGSGMINPTRAWVAPGSLAFFSPVSQLTNNALGVRLKSAGMAGTVLSRFNATFNYAGVTLQYSIFKSAFMSTYQLIAGILLILSILAIVVSVYLTRAIIIKSIYDDYRLTGILKAQGFTPGNVISIYVLQYLLLAIVCIAIGCLATYFILQLMVQSIMHTIGIVALHLPLAVIFSVSFIIILIIVFITTIKAALKTTKIKPAEAIKYGAPIQTPKATLRGILAKHWLPLLPALSIRALLEDKKRALVTFTVLAFTIFVLLFSSGVTTSLSRLKYNKAAWGFENGDIQLARNGGPISFTHEQLKEVLAGEKEISAVTPFSYENIIVLSSTAGQRVNLFGKAYEGDIAKAGLTTLAGHYPAAGNEIALCTGTAKLLGKQPGDTINVFIEGQEMRLAISGIYQDISNMGQGFRLSSKTMEKLNPLYEPTNYSIKLVSTANADEYMRYLLKKYGNTITINMNIEDRLQQMGIVSNMMITFSLLAVFFIAILLLAVWNDVAMSIYSYRKPFGIFKTTGFTPKQLRGLLVWKMALLCGLALIIMVPLALLVSPMLMGLVTENFGISQFPFSANAASILVITLVFAGCVVLCAWASSAGAAKVNPRTLLVGQ